MNIVDSFKRGYYAAEDRYYAVLDKINRFVPIYKLIDPIDRVFPSFIFFIALIACLVIFFALLTAPQIILSSTLRVVDEASNPLEGVGISVSFSAETAKKIDLNSDAWGEARLAMPSKELEAEITLQKKGFDSLSKSVTLKANEVTEFILSREKIILQEKKFDILVVESDTGYLINKPVQLAFSCSSGVAAVPQFLTKPNGEFKGIVPVQGCGILLAKAMAEGFEPKNSVAITVSPTYIRLDKAKTTGEINVLVKDHIGDAVAAVSLRLFDKDNAVVDQTSSDSSGTAVFSEVKPGTYSITATAADGRFAEETGIVVTPGDSQSVSIALPELLKGKKLLLQLVNAETKANVADATVLIYANNKLLDSKTSSGSGLVEKMISDENAAIAAVIWHESFVAKIVEKVSLVDAASNTPQIIELTPRSANNNGGIRVMVTNYDTKKAVAQAEVKLYNRQWPELILNYPYSLTNNDGNVLFEGLPGGTYFAIATKEDTEGKSNDAALVLGSTINLNIVLVLTEGDVLVKVVDGRTLDAEGKIKPVEGAEVAVFDAFTYSQLPGGATDAKGEFKSAKFKSNKTVYLRISKENYLSAVSTPIQIIANSTAQATVQLYSKDDVDLSKTITIDFGGFFSDKSAKNKVKILESGQDYFILFRLTLPKDANYNNLMHHLRVGPESVVRLQPAGYKIRLQNFFSASATAVPAFSSCFDASNVFSNPADCISSSAAKQVNTTWQAASGRTVYSLILKADTERSLADGTPIELRYIAKALVAGAEFTTPLFLKEFKIGQSLCTPGKDCNVVEWSGCQLQEQGGQPIPLSNFSTLNKQQLSVNMQYALSCEMHNTSGFDLDNAALQASNANPTGVLNIEGKGNSATVFSARQFQQDSVTTFNPLLSFNTVKEAQFTELHLNLTAKKRFQTEQLSSSQALFFSVKAEANLVLNVSPVKLTANDPGQKITGTVKAGGNPISGATVNVQLPWDVNPIIRTTGSDGNFDSGELPSLPPGSKVTVTAQAPKYNDATVLIPVEWGDYFDPRYNCVKVQPIDAQGSVVEVGGKKLLQFNVKPKEHGSFSVITADCPERVETRFNSELQVELASNTGIATFTADNPLNGEEVYLGQYPIYVKAKFASDIQFVNAVKVLVIISDPAGSCYSIDKTRFDLASQPKDSGEITNSCPVQFNDAWSPELALDTFKALINRTDVTIPDAVQFKWGVKAKLLLSQPVYSTKQVTTRTGWESFDIPTGQDTGTTVDKDIKVDVGDIVKNITAFKFEAIVPEPCSAAVPPTDYSSWGYIKGSSIKVNPNGAINVSNCTSSGCTWAPSSGCVTGMANCQNLSNECYYYSFEVPFNKDKIDSIILPIYNRENKAFLYFQLKGDVTDTASVVSFSTEEKEVGLASFNSAIVPMRNLGYPLATLASDLKELVKGKFKEQFPDANWASVIDVNIFSFSESKEIETWIAGNMVFAKFVGDEANDDPGKTPFEIQNLSLNTTQYNLIYVDDYVNKLKGG